MQKVKNEAGGFLTKTVHHHVATDPRTLSIKIEDRNLKITTKASSLSLIEDLDNFDGITDDLFDEGIYHYYLTHK